MDLKVSFRVAICLAFLFVSVFSEVIKNKVFVPTTKNLFDFDSNGDILNHERHARHVQAVTESVVNHVMKELRKRFPDANKKLSKKHLDQVAEELAKLVQKMNRRKRNKTNGKGVWKKKLNSNHKIYNQIN